MKNYVYIAASLDGYIARADGGLDWLSMADLEGEDYGFYKFYSSMDTIVMGRKTYETAVNFDPWPYSEKKCTVYTSGNFSAKYNESFFSGSLEELHDHLVKSGADSVYVDGGQLIQGFLERGYIDEFTVSILPVILGEGIPLFSKLSKEKKLTLKHSKSYDTGLVQLCYSIK